MPITIVDIAKQIGVSNQAVSVALRGAPGVGPRTREKILRVASEMGYRSNASAKAFRSGRQGRVGLLMSCHNERSHLPAPLLRGIESTLSGLGLGLTVGRLPDEHLLQDAAIPTLLREWAADALLVNYQESIPAKIAKLLDNDNVPAVWLNTQQPNPCVYADDLNAGRQITERLIQMGHREIVYVDYSHCEWQLPDSHYSARDRQKGYEQAMAAASLRARVLRGKDRILGYQRVVFSKQWLQGPDRPTAAIFYSGSNAVPAMFAAAELRLRVPADLSVASFDDEPNGYSGLAITSMLTPQEQLGRSAVNMIQQMLAGAVVTPGALSVPFGFAAGQTTAGR